MISENEILDAIAETERQPVSFQNCEKLAVFYTILEHKQAEQRHYSRKAGETEFFSAIADKDLNSVMSVINELLETLNVIENKLYTETIRTLKEL